MGLDRRFVAFIIIPDGADVRLLQPGGQQGQVSEF